jgi:KipI family sensor histidine kinase inhibitor
MSTSLQLLNNKFEIQNFNNDFLILKSKNGSELSKIAKAIFERKFEFVDEVIVTEVEVCLKLNALFEPSKYEQLKNIRQHGALAQNSYKLPIYFNDHEDWVQVEKISGLNKNEFISKLTTCKFTVAMLGFLPGFFYINGLPKSLQIPRKAVPSKYVKANSIAIGGKYLGLYSLNSPGGWNVIGQVPISLLKIPELPPVAINLGDKLILHSIEKEAYNELLAQQISLQEYNA